MRQFVADLAHRFPVTDLPTESSGRVDQSVMTIGKNILGPMLSDSTIIADRTGGDDAAFQFTQWNDMNPPDVHPPGANEYTTLHVIPGLYPPPATATSTFRHLDGISDTATALLPNGTAIRILTTDPEHRQDNQNALDQIVATITTSTTPVIQIGTNGQVSDNEFERIIERRAAASWMMPAGVVRR